MYDNKLLFDAVRALQVIPDAKLQDFLTTAQDQDKSLADILLDQNVISEDQLGVVIADIYKVPFIHLANIAIPKEILTIIPEIISKQQNIIAFKKDVKGLYVAMADPSNKEIIQFLSSKLGIPIFVHFAVLKEIAVAQTLYLKEIGKAFEEIIAQNLEEAKNKRDAEIEPPIIKIVETVISYANENNASDIHLEPEDDQALVRFRIDGVLHDIIQFSPDIYLQIVSRIKVMANLRIDEHLVPQDGKIQFVQDSKVLDIRVSIVPVKKGEKVVMRLLSQRSRQISLLSLGLSEKDLQTVKLGYEKQFGMILASGPTGCGKTTTMYAILKILNNRDVNIMTIEDPIEYDIEGINQMQVNAKANFTFGEGLRSILRQDPNIILVGEIRDDETAGIAVNAAMTGHLVLSTLHTNDAATAIPRLFEMNIEPFLIASTLNLIVAQRLVRKIHMACRISEEVDRSELLASVHEDLVNKVFGVTKSVTVYKGKGCEVCHNSGYADRTGIFEVMLIDDELRKAITEKQDSSTIAQIAHKNGMRTMLEDGLEKVKIGDTSLSEVLRVIKE